MKPNCNQPELTRNFVDIMADNNLTQVVKEPTYYENTLDLFFVNNPSIVHNSKVIPGISKDGHHAVYVELDISLTRRTKKPRNIHSYNKLTCRPKKRSVDKFDSSDPSYCQFLIKL